MKTNVLIPGNLLILALRYAKAYSENMSFTGTTSVTLDANSFGKRGYRPFPPRRSQIFDEIDENGRPPLASFTEALVWIGRANKTFHLITTMEMIESSAGGLDRTGWPIEIVTARLRISQNFVPHYEAAWLRFLCALADDEIRPSDLVYERD